MELNKNEEELHTTHIGNLFQTSLDGCFDNLIKLRDIYEDKGYYNLRFSCYFKSNLITLIGTRSNNAVEKEEKEIRRAEYLEMKDEFKALEEEFENN